MERSGLAREVCEEEQEGHGVTMSMWDGIDAAVEEERAGALTMDWQEPECAHGDACEAGAFGTIDAQDDGRYGEDSGSATTTSNEPVTHPLFVPAIVRHEDELSGVPSAAHKKVAASQELMPIRDCNDLAVLDDSLLPFADGWDTRTWDDGGDLPSVTGAPEVLDAPAAVLPACSAAEEELPLLPSPADTDAEQSDLPAPEPARRRRHAAEDNPAVSGQRTVLRGELVRDVLSKLAETGIAIVSAPGGFGKTTLLKQIVDAVAKDAERGESYFTNVRDLSGDAVRGRIDSLARSGPASAFASARPLIAIDDIPRLAGEEAERTALSLQRLNASGFDVLVSTLPTNRALLAALKRVSIITARSLIIQPREYSDWAHEFSIARSLDVYGLTQGVPALVALLQVATERQFGGNPLDAGIVTLYRGILAELRRARDPLYRMVCMILLVGKGVMKDFNRCGMRLQPGTVMRLVRDYPVFGMERADAPFSCLGCTSNTLDALRRDIADRRPAFAVQAVRVLVRAGLIDNAVHLARLVLDIEDRLALIAQFPLQFSLAGHAGFVTEALADQGSVPASSIETGVMLAVYAAALIQGDIRLARRAAMELSKRVDDIDQQIRWNDWDCACALSEVWGSVSGIALPELDVEGQRNATPAAACLRAHARIYRELIGGIGNPAWNGAEKLADADGDARELDVPSLLLSIDQALDRALHGEGVSREELARLDDAADVARERRLGPLCVRARVAASVCRLLEGGPLLDDRAFADGGTTAVRESDLPSQLFCLVAEGWQDLGRGQAVNAEFRAQQAIKLAESGQVFIRSWAVLLERTAFLRAASRMKIRDEAEALDLSQKRCLPAEAWSIALHLSAARYDSELAAWCSLHKVALLNPRFRPLARHALSLLGSRGDSMRQQLPRNEVASYTYTGTALLPSDSMFEVATGRRAVEPGQVVINLLGGFHVERNGHVLTGHMWRRKKAGVLAARLMLGLGSFVSRRTIVDELWPDCEYARGRENLYVTLSALRRALGQHEGGPQYVITQGDGVALNDEYVYSDVKRFEGLAREILLSGESVTAQQTVEVCLKMEQLYRGPLYVPDSGDPSFFVHMRRQIGAKFVDCMVCGVDRALEVENVSSAAWLVDAALREAPTREDVIRRAMRVYDLCGRRREIVELYNSHLLYLRRELNTEPELATREMYDRIVGHVPML